MFSCLTLESEAINGRESSTGIGQERLNCNGGEQPERSWAGCQLLCVVGATTFTACNAAHSGRSCLVVVCDSEVPPWRILERKVEGGHLESQRLSKLEQRPPG